MVELGELAAHHADFERRNVQMVVASLEGPEDAQQIKNQWENFIVIADKDRGLASQAQVIHKRSGHGGGDTTAPTTILIDRHGIVRWLFRPDRFLERLSPEEVLEAVDKHLASNQPKTTRNS
jgi:peroxiredoxin